MAVDPFTDEEHYARAMLMGLRYMREGGYYAAIFGFSRPLDAITLEPLSLKERVARLQNRKERYYD